MAKLIVRVKEHAHREVGLIAPVTAGGESAGRCVMQRRRGAAPVEAPQIHGPMRLKF
jgi:hypothetical protein